MKRAAFFVSLLTNIVLIALLLRPPSAIGPEGQAEQSVIPMPSSHGSGVDASSSPVAIRERLASTGFSEDMAKAMLLGWLEARAREELPLPAPEYWRGDGANTAAMAARQRQLERVRQGLVEAYGENALEDPAFERVVTLQRAATSSSQTVQAATGAAGLGFEAGLRESPLAAQLRSSGVEFTEQEFRATFRVMQEFQAKPSPERLVEHRDAVRAILGRDRALRVIAAGDPGFRTIQEVGDKHRLGSERTFAAYEIVLDAQERMVGVIQTGAADLRRAEEIRIAIESRDRRLYQLLGENIAHELIAAQAMSMRSNDPNKRVIN